MSQPECTVETFVIRKGAVYVYQAELPAGCKGGRYRVADFLIDVPSYQPKVLVQCLSGKDAGLRFTVTEINFVRRYVLADDQPARLPVARDVKAEVAT